MRSAAPQVGGGGIWPDYGKREDEGLGQEETRENRKCAIRDSQAESNGHWVREGGELYTSQKGVLLEPCQKGKVPLGQI